MMVFYYGLRTQSDRAIMYECTNGVDDWSLGGKKSTNFIVIYQTIYIHAY